MIPSFNTVEPKSNSNLNLKVGVYENSPKIYTNDEGEVRGFFPDILTYIASKEKWEIEYVHGSWSEGLSHLETNQIDILPDVGYSSERAENYDFNNLSVLTSWALIYTLEDSDIKSIDDLQNKKIGVMKDDIDYIGPDGIKLISEKYKLNITFVEYSSLIEVLENIEGKEVDAGVVNELFGNLNAFKYEVIKTAIVFNPIEFKFGFPKNASLNSILIEKIDYWLEILKNNPQSYYYESYQLYFSEIPRPETLIPSWILPSGLGLVSIIILTISISILLRHQVRVKTEKLHESEQRFRSLVESSSDWIWEIDKNGKYIYISPKIEDLLGYKPDEIIGKTPFDLMPPDEAERVSKLFDNIIREQKPFDTIENVCLHKDGKRVILETSGLPIFDEDKNLIGYRGIDRNITELKEIQEKLMLAQKMEAIGRFAGCIAHDFNNLLTVINGLSAMMIEDIPNENQEIMDNLEEIYKAGDRGASLTKQLLAFSRKQIFEPRVINLNNLIKNMEPMLKRLVSEDISINFIYYDRLANIFVDSTQIEQVVMNLVLNARDAMPKGGDLIIETSYTHIPSENALLDVKSGDYVQISVSDTGIGMNKEELSHLFEPFYTTKGPEKGTGLGLSTVFGIVKQCYGDISVYSKVGEGTTFKVYLPQTVHHIEKQHQLKKYPNEALRGTETILVVEDEDSIRQFIVKILKSKGYNVLYADNPEKALEISRNFDKKIHLLLTDIIMPIMTGKELADIILKKNPNMPVLFVSGYVDKAIDELNDSEKGLNFLPKPFSSTDLLKMVRDILSTHS